MKLYERKKKFVNKEINDLRKAIQRLKQQRRALQIKKKMENLTQTSGETSSKIERKIMVFLPQLREELDSSSER